jgi:hypothetical protein
VGLSARAELVVIGRHAHAGLPGPGSVTHAVLTHAHGPVVTVPGGCRHVIRVLRLCRRSISGQSMKEKTSQKSGGYP